MRVTSLHLQNFRSFEGMDTITLDQINVLIGANNSGKSTILKALHLLQNGSGSPFQDVRVNNRLAKISMQIEGVRGISSWAGGKDLRNLGLSIEINTEDRLGGSIQYNFTNDKGQTYSLLQLPNKDPNHFIVPYYSKRKPADYHEDVRADHALGINNDFSFLAAKLSRIANPGFPKFQRYKETCEAILGFLVTAVPSAAGQKPGIYLPDNQIMHIDQMGEGVPNIVGLLTDLAVSQNKLFLIEEPENDLHPKALKALLDLILDSATNNQFVISTHSNIVTRHLASHDRSKLFNVTVEPGKLPTQANISQVDTTPESRLVVLRDLGYSFSDFDLWDGWLILEESSAERIIRDYLIPWFTPRLSRLRTLSTKGADQIEPTFDDFFRLVRFTHLENAYRNAAWVRVDGDTKGEEITQRLKSSYSTWEQNRFATYSNDQFEKYYPKSFNTTVNTVLSMTDKREKRKAKKALLEEVMVWLDEDRNRGQEALQESAAEVIEDLKKIESELASLRG